MKDTKKEIKKEEEKNIVKKDDSKKKQIITFVMGLLVGAIVTTGIFLVIRTNDRPRNMPNFDPSNIKEGNFDKSNFPKGDRGNKPSRNKDNTTESDKTVESGE